MKLQANARILVCDFRRIGDGIMSLPIFEALKKRYPTCHTTFVCEHIARGIADNNPFIDEVFYFDGGFFSTLRLVFRLRSRRFDVAIDSLGMPKTAILTYLSKAAHRIGIHKKRAFFYTELYRGHFPHEYSAHHKLSVLHLLDAFPPDPLPLPFINTSPAAKAAAAKVLARLGLKAGEFLTSSPTSKVAHSLWSAQNWARLYDEIYAEFGLVSVLIYAPAEAPRVLEITALLKNKDACVTDESFGDIQTLAAFLGLARLHFTQDNGTKHLANTQKTPCVSLWRYDSNPANWQIPRTAGVIDEILFPPDFATGGEPLSANLVSVEVFKATIAKILRG
ncbi:MAG: glycosyltransferase family 9 protein [Helicobacteraceae bacterium]